jgi:hypothetical protein
MTAMHWYAANGEVFQQDEANWTQARDWALKRQLITKSVPASSYFTNAYVK